ncbi:hypothetical protein ACQJBY_010090 [Aegilops geniculata]
MDLESTKLLLRFPRESTQYSAGVDEFLEFAYKDIPADTMIRCPCEDCVHTEVLSRDEVRGHLMWNGMLQSYDKWVFHGESSSDHNDDQQPQPETEGNANMHEMIMDSIRKIYDGDVPMSDSTDFSNPLPDGATKEAEALYKLIQDSEKPLWPGCELSQLSLLALLFNTKSMNKWSDKSFGDLLNILHMAIPNGKALPQNFYEAKKIISKFGLGYQKIHVCPNNCQLFWKETENDDFCSKCKASRWKDKMPETKLTKKERKRATPMKVLRYFPIKEWLKRIFMCKETATLARWHDEGRTKQHGVIRHPADSEAWKKFDEKHGFADDCRNIRFAIATDGFNPYGMLSNKYSCWPVVLVMYNLPPWLCMKKSYLSLSLIIPGPKSPGDKIHVFMQPLLEDLRDLFVNGMTTYDASEQKTFKLRAAVLWTINDFPALGMIASYMVHGDYACPPCGANVWTKRLKYGKKACFMGHRRFLPPDHEFRNDASAFDGTTENRTEPITYYGRSVLDDIAACGDFSTSKTYKGKSSLFTLPYWDSNLLRHNLDVMHIEKNVCDNIIGTLLNLDGKSKDNVQARQDLEDMNIRGDLHPQKKPSGKYYLPPAIFTMSKNEKQLFCKVIHSIKVPDGYCGNISKCVNFTEGKISGLKTHDCHVLLHQFLPIAARGILPDDVTAVLFELSSYFRGICSKVLHVDELDRLEERIKLTLCKMEMIFPPGFFTVMVHLVVHLASECKIAGPVAYRWMYFIERYLGELKSFVRNKARPEGSIAESFLSDE